jgi:GTP cyclohydrolase II
MTNNPLKVESLKALGIEVSERDCRWSLKHNLKMPAIWKSNAP